MNKLITLLSIITLFISCSHEQIGIIEYKSVLIENPAFARYTYFRTPLQDIGFIDSSNRYSIGDSVNKYSLKNKIK